MGYVEDAFKVRTTYGKRRVLARRGRAGKKSGCFSILLCREKVEMIRRSGAMTDCQTMANSLGEIGLGRLHGVVHGFASREMGRNGRSERATGAMRMRSIDEFPLEHIEE